MGTTTLIFFVLQVVLKFLSVALAFLAEKLKEKDQVAASDILFVLSKIVGMFGMGKYKS